MVIRFLEQRISSKMSRHAPHHAQVARADAHQRDAKLERSKTLIAKKWKPFGLVAVRIFTQMKNRTSNHEYKAITPHTMLKLSHSFTCLNV